jgi:hypothetical protein
MGKLATQIGKTRGILIHMPLPVLRQKDFAHQPRYQLWTDALCFREMAKQAPNNYLKSMCVRNAVLAAWTTLEMACCDSLSVPELPDRIFKEGLKKALNKAGRPAIDFGSGLWQRVLKLQESRNDYTHMGGKLINRLPPVSVAEHAIITIREAIHDIYGRMETPSPSWVDADQSGGWPQTGGFSATAHLTLVRGQLDQNAPETFRIALVTEAGVEKVTDFFPGKTPEEDVLEQVEDLLGRLNAAFSGVRVYQGPTLIYEEIIDVRG